MPGNLKEGIDRRNLIIASIATVGAANVLVASAGAGRAQDNAVANSAVQDPSHTGRTRLQPLYGFQESWTIPSSPA